ncbi:MAG: response regulator, partial [Candidatus Marinimicrobia bacterium]|nr:response regulator [Candidatus Neomarinimicrobiota bacterium]
MNILIVDDKKESLYLLETMLKGNGYHTFSASNGKEALQILDKQEIDLIISDILMPEMDGFQLCKAVKTSDKFRQIPFVFYTATFTTRQDEILALKLGASRFLRKPMEPEKFLEQIQGLMENLKEGDLQSQEPKYKDEEEVLRLYDERLVTKLEKKMKDLGEERALFTEVFDRVPLLMTMYDPDIKILRLNDAFTKTTGWTEDDTRR